MKRALSVFLLLGFLTSLSGCAPGTRPADEGAAAPVMTEIGAWPENEYTEAIFPPEAGEPFYTLSDAQGGMFSIFYQDITREQGEQYAGALCADGFSVLEQTAEASASGLLLEKDGVLLNLSLAEGVLGLRISLPPDAQS